MPPTKTNLPGLRSIAARILGLALAAALLTQCAAPISVRHVKPATPSGVEVTPSTIGGLLDTVHDSYRRLAAGDNSGLADYNFAVARLVEELECSGADPWSGTLAVSGSQDVRSLKGRAPKGIHPLPEQLIPADTLSFQGEDAAYPARAAGIGAPLVAVKSFENLGHQQVRKNLPLRNLTAVVRFSGTTATLDLIEPLKTENVNLAGRRRPLAADYGAAVMLGLSKARIDKLGFARLLNPSRYDDTARLNFVQPYDPKRIPVLLVHGLDSTPATFARMYTNLLRDEEIRKRYQFWIFSYPSGYPYPYSAMLLRRELDEVNSEFPDHRDIVLIGHSMGSMISRLMVTDAGDQLWRDTFGSPVEETKVTGGSRDLLEEYLVFHNRPEIDRVIFYSGPHRGATLASIPIARWASRLIRLPNFMADVRNTMVSVATVDAAAMQMSRAPSSLDTLNPNNHFVLGINKIPIVPDVTYHSVVGDRGKGDTPDSSDGLVPYWSSHLEGAASELVVPSGHSSQQHPQGIEEARRILRLHLEQHP